jgi:hypothetical protein
MQSKRGYLFVLAICLGFLLFISLVGTVHRAGAQAKHPVSSILASSTLSAPSIQDFQSSTRLGNTLDITFTPVCTVYLPITLRNWPWTYTREFEYPDRYSVGRLIYRSNASNSLVHGQFGCTRDWQAMAGYVEYLNITIPQFEHLYLVIRYSKHSDSQVPIRVYIDAESTPRATFYPENQGGWDNFTQCVDVVGLGITGVIDLGSIDVGPHSIKLETDGQQFGVADLDKFSLTNNPSLPVSCN